MAGGDTILRPLRSGEEVEAMMAAPVAVLYKHSPTCWRSFMAVGQVRRFALEREDLPVWMVDVAAGREMARTLAKRLGIVHESPQVILLRYGEPVWHASHLGVRYRSIVAAVEESGAGPGESGESGGNVGAA